MSFEENLRRTCRTLPQEPLPATVRTRILRELPGKPSPGGSSVLRQRGVVFVLVAGIVLLLMTLPNPALQSNAIAEVSAAIGQANTWHFTGWRLKKGQKVRWEIWGRRSPFLYREQIGAEILLDDGKRQLHLLPPDPENGRKKGVCLIKASQSLTRKNPMEDPRAGFLMGLGGDSTDFGLLKTTAHQQIFESIVDYLSYPQIRESATITIDRKTSLPVHYALQRTEFKPGGSLKTGLDFRKVTPLRSYPQAELQPEYNIALPEGVAATTLPSEYFVIDATRTPPTEVFAHHDRSVATKNGLTVWAEVLAQDTAGNLHLRIHGWLGKEKIFYRNSRLLVEPGLDKKGSQDNQGNFYIGVSGPQTGPIDKGSTDLWVVPLEPLRPRTPRPTVLDMNLNVGISQYERIGDGGRSIPLVSESFMLHLVLPKPVADVGYDRAIGREGDDYRGPRPTLEGHAAQNRAFTYLDAGMDRLRPVRSRVDLLRGSNCAALDPSERATYWWNRAADDAARKGDKKTAKDFRQNARNVPHWLK